MNVVPDLTQFRKNPVICPTLEWTPQIDTDDLPKNASVDTFDIIGRQRHRSEPYLPVPAHEIDHEFSQRIAPFLIHRIVDRCADAADGAMPCQTDHPPR